MDPPLMSDDDLVRLLEQQIYSLNESIEMVNLLYQRRMGNPYWQGWGYMAPAPMPAMAFQVPQNPPPYSAPPPPPPPLAPPLAPPPVAKPPPAPVAKLVEKKRVVGGGGGKPKGPLRPSNLVKHARYHESDLVLVDCNYLLQGGAKHSGTSGFRVDFGSFRRLLQKQCSLPEEGAGMCVFGDMPKAVMLEWGRLAKAEVMLGYYEPKSTLWEYAVAFLAHRVHLADGKRVKLVLVSDAPGNLAASAREAHCDLVLVQWAQPPPIKWAAQHVDLRSHASEFSLARFFKTREGVKEEEKKA